MPKNIELITKKLNKVEKTINDLFLSQSYTAKRNEKELDFVYKKIDDAINNNANEIFSVNNIPNLSKLYTRLLNKNSSSIHAQDRSLEDFFNDDSIKGNILSLYNYNQSITAQDKEIDMILRWMPKLEQALIIKKDNVLSADSFNKEFISLSSESSGNGSVISSQLDNIKTKYDLDTKVDEWMMKIFKYGEVFIYVVPYKKAIERLLKRKNGCINSGQSISSKRESFILYENGTFDQKYKNKYFSENCSNKVSGKVEITFHYDGILENIIENYQHIERSTSFQNNIASLSESFFNEKSSNKKYKFDKTIPDDLEFELSTDGTYDNSIIKTKKEDDDINIKVPGAIVRELSHDKIIPIYIEEICVGYYYIDIDVNNDIIISSNTMNQMMNGFCNSNTLKNNKKEYEDFIRIISNRLAQDINARFVNNNEDLAQSIYLILLANDKLNSQMNYANINITFIPIEDIHHLYFELCPYTHHGKSSLLNSILPAKIWILLQMCFNIGYLTRGQDKRIYYVKQTIDTNVSHTLLNVLNQIKKGRFGIREIESLDSTLGILGQFNDYMIPVGPSGDSPIQFETMPGQQIDLPSDIMDRMEDQSISPTEVPLELVNAVRSIDYAVHYTMSNSKFLKTVFKIQSRYSKLLSKICTCIYNFEYNSKRTVTVILPMPIFLSMVNTTQLLDNTKIYISNLIEVEYANESDEFKAIMTKKLLHYHLASYMNIAMLDKMADEVKLEILNTTNNEE